MVYQGDTNIAYLNEHGVSIWDEWADETGDLGPVYGRQYATKKPRWGEDQLADVVHLINQSGSRRMLVTA